jgi:DNA-binding MarR family transcriptional regulator
MTVSELMWRGCYLGSNVSYNLKKLTETGYVVQERSAHDRRVMMVRASPKGADLCAALKSMNERHLNGLSQGAVKTEDLVSCRKTLKGLQEFWTRAIEPGAMAAAARSAV